MGRLLVISDVVLQLWLQIMLDIAVDNSKRELYLLHLVKSVVMEARPTKAGTISDASEHV